MMDVRHTLEYQELESKNQGLEAENLAVHKVIDQQDIELAALRKQVTRMWEALKAWQSVHHAITIPFVAPIHQEDHRGLVDEHWADIDKAIAMTNNVLSETEEE